MAKKSSVCLIMAVPESAVYVNNIKVYQSDFCADDNSLSAICDALQINFECLCFMDEDSNFIDLISKEEDADGPGEFLDDLKEIKKILKKTGFIAEE